MNERRYPKYADALPLLFRSDIPEKLRRSINEWCKDERKAAQGELYRLGELNVKVLSGDTLTKEENLEQVSLADELSHLLP